MNPPVSSPGPVFCWGIQKATHGYVFQDCDRNSHRKNTTGNKPKEIRKLTHIKRSNRNWKLFEDEIISGENVETKWPCARGKGPHLLVPVPSKIGTPFSFLGGPILMTLGVGQSLDAGFQHFGGPDSILDCWGHGCTSPGPSWRTKKMSDGWRENGIFVLCTAPSLRSPASLEKLRAHLNPRGSSIPHCVLLREHISSQSLSQAFSHAMPPTWTAFPPSSLLQIRSVLLCPPSLASPLLFGILGVLFRQGCII